MEDGAPLGSEESANRRLSSEPVATQRRGTSASDPRQSSSRPAQSQPSHSLPPGPGPSVDLSELPPDTADASKTTRARRPSELQRLREENHALLARVAELSHIQSNQVSAAAAAGGRESEDSSDSEPAREAVRDVGEGNDSDTTAAVAAVSTAAASAAAAAAVAAPANQDGGRSAADNERRRRKNSVDYHDEPDTPITRYSEPDTPITPASALLRVQHEAEDEQSESERESERVSEQTDEPEPAAVPERSARVGEDARVARAAGWGGLRTSFKSVSSAGFRPSLRTLVSGRRSIATDEDPGGISGVLETLGEASRTLGEGIRAAFGLESIRRSSGGGNGSRKGSRCDEPRQPAGGAVAVAEGSGAAVETLEVTVLARSTQIMPMDASLRRTLREISEIAAERRAVEALRQRGSLGALSLGLSLGQAQRDAGDAHGLPPVEPLGGRKKKKQLLMVSVLVDGELIEQPISGDLQNLNASQFAQQQEPTYLPTLAILAAHCSPLTTHYSLLTTFYLLRTTHDSLPTTYYPLPISYLQGATAAPHAGAPRSRAARAQDVTAAGRAATTHPTYQPTYEPTCSLTCVLTCPLTCSLTCSLTLTGGPSGSGRSQSSWGRAPCTSPSPFTLALAV